MSRHVQKSPQYLNDASRWPDRTRVLCLQWKSASTEADRDRVLAELWVLVNATLARYVRLHCRTLGTVDAEDVRDIASEKAMAFVHNLRSGVRDMADMHAAQISAYVSVLARNGLVDTLRKRKRQAPMLAGSYGAKMERVAPESDGAEISVRHEQFLRAICQCVGSFTPRAQTAWFLRTFFDMPSERIAAHPNVRTTVSAVDMMLSRTRHALRDCMNEKGFGADDAPPGTLVALWELLSKRNAAAIAIIVLFERMISNL